MRVIVLITVIVVTGGAQEKDSLREHLEAEGGHVISDNEGDDDEHHGYPHHVGDYVGDSEGEGEGEGEGDVDVDVEGGDVIGGGVNVNGGVVEDIGVDDDGNAGDEMNMNHGMNSFDIYAAADAVGMQEVVLMQHTLLHYAMTFPPRHKHSHILPRFDLLTQLLPILQSPLLYCNPGGCIVLVASNRSTPNQHHQQQ